MFSGSIPALVTPFRNGALDEAALRKLAEWQIAEGSAALVPCGTTGESPTLSFDEHYRVIEIVIEAAAGRVPVIAGCGSNDTATAVRHMERAQAMGAAAALVVVPYYNKPSQDGLYAHYAHLAERSTLPIILYNVPGRTVADLKPETVARLAQLPTIVGIKDASGDLGRIASHADGAGKPFCQLSGNDESALAFNAGGGVGCISVSANVAPRLCAEMQAATARGDWETARAQNAKLQLLHLALFSDTSPAPTKYALARLHDWFDPELRLPIIPASEASRRAVDAALTHAGLI